MEETLNAAALPQPKKKPGFWRTMLETLKTSLAPTAILAVLWLVLSWVRSAGIQWAILWPLNFLTGALAGMEGSALGGAIGKAILLICFNSLFRGLLMRRKWDGRRRDNVKDELKAQTKAQLFGRIPQYSNLKLLWKDRSPRMLAAGLLGGAAALGITAGLITPLYQSTTKIYVMNQQNEDNLTYSDMQLGSQLILG